MTQVQLATHAGTTQSVVSAYESGRREPSLPVLLGLLAATGHSLQGSLVASPPDESSSPLSGPLGRRVRRHRARIKDVAASYGAGNVRVIGSVARGAESADSDVDLLLDLPAGVGLFTLGRLRQDLEDLLHARVDLVPADGLKPEVRANVESGLVPL
ncbi:MAG: transcriptional regulator, family [Blastococcus sp.]|nr:transcriptional regulator, family [Blastococcus sp.]